MAKNALTVLSLVLLCCAQVNAQSDNANPADNAVVGSDVPTQQSENKAENLKIGFVNIRKLMAQAPQLETIQKNLAEEFKKENQTIVVLRTEIAKLSAQYDNDADKQQQVSLQARIDNKQREIARLQKRLQDAYSLRRNEALGKLQTLIVNMVAKVSQERRLDIVLNNTGVIYVNSRIDITPTVFSYLAEQPLD